MPVVAFAFGSLGDITALLQLAWQLSRTLADLTGASGELCELVADIRTFARTLEELERAIAERRIDLRPEVLVNVQLSIACGHAILKGIESKIAAFNRLMTGPRGPGLLALRRYWAVASWEILGGRKEVDTLMGRLRDHLSNLQANISLSQSASCTAMIASVSTHGTTIAKVLAVLEGIQRNIGPGMPPFHFFEWKTMAPYAPFARCGLQRILSLSDSIFPTALDHVNSGGSYYFKCSGSGKTTVSTTIDDALATLGGVSTDGTYMRVTCVPYSKPDWKFHLDCFFFNSVFGEVEVVLGLPPHKRRYQRADWAVQIQAYLRCTLASGDAPLDSSSLGVPQVFDITHKHFLTFLRDTYHLVTHWSP
ncbi:hypothetical protein AURDEDRAFT_186928, partial [Auricularia subglabra TFB-10046 SS5]